MIDSIEILHMAQQLAENAAARQSVVARNIAHADTPGYLRQELPSFAETYRDLEPGIGMRSTRAGHIGGTTTPGTVNAIIDRGGTIKPNGNNVSLEDEILEAAQIRQQHDMALSIYRSSLGVIRASLGRS